MIRRVLLVIAVAMLVLAGYLVLNDGVKIELSGAPVIVDEVRNTGEGLEHEIIDFNKPEKGYS